MTSFCKDARVWCGGSKAVGTLAEDVKGPTVTVNLDSGLSVTEFVNKLELLPHLNAGCRVQHKDKGVLGDFVKMVNSLFAEVRFDKALSPVQVDVRKLRVVALPQKTETTTERGTRRLERKTERSAKAWREAVAKREKEAATKAIRLAMQSAAQATAAKKKQQKEAKKKR